MACAGGCEALRSRRTPPHEITADDICGTAVTARLALTGADTLAYIAGLMETPICGATGAAAASAARRGPQLTSLMTEILWEIGGRPSHWVSTSMNTIKYRQRARHSIKLRANTISPRVASRGHQTSAPRETARNPPTGPLANLPRGAALCGRCGTSPAATAEHAGGDARHLPDTPAPPLDTPPPPLRSCRPSVAGATHGGSGGTHPHAQPQKRSALSNGPRSYGRSCA